MEQELHKALVDYATQHAGTDADIDLELENAAADYLSSSESEDVKVPEPFQRFSQPQTRNR